MLELRSLIQKKVARAIRVSPLDLIRHAKHLTTKHIRAIKETRGDQLHPSYAIGFVSKGLKSLIEFESENLDDLDQKWAIDVSRHALAHEFNLLGSHWSQVVATSPFRINSANLEEAERLRKLLPSNYQAIDWHSDFKSGFRWDSRLPSQQITFGNQKGVDVKVPWELARCQHLPVLAIAQYTIGKANPAGAEQIYAQEFRNQILDFISANPPRFGVNWVCSMDVGIRIANWLIAYDLFKASGITFDSDFEEIFERSVYEHGLHIYNHLEWSASFRGNHFLSNLAGIIFASSYLSPTSETKRWLKYASTHLIDEILIQFQNDGSNFEASTSYHRLSYEISIFSLALLSRTTNALESPKGIQALQRIRLAHEFTSSVLKPSGDFSQIGDNDSGSFFKLSSEYISSQMLNALARTGLNLSKGEIAREKFKVFRDFGLFIYHISDWHLTIRCGSIGQNGRGGHAHNDQLSIELSLGEADFFVDLGTYCYTPDIESRNLFRSTRSHNTLWTTDSEQNNWQSGPIGVFELENQARAKVISATDRKFVGEHYGFLKPHRRQINIEANVIEIDDTLDLDDKKGINLWINPQVTVDRISQRMIKLQLGEQNIYVQSFSTDWEIVDGNYSPAYGIRIPCKGLRLTTNDHSIRWAVKKIL